MRVYFGYGLEHVPLMKAHRRQRGHWRIRCPETNRVLDRALTLASAKRRVKKLQEDRS